MQFDVHPFIEGYVDAILTEESLFAAAMKKVKLSRRCLLHSRKGTKIIDQIVDNFLLKSHAQLVDSVSFQFSKWVGEMYASPIIPRFSITEPKCSLEENEHRVQEKKKLVLKLSEGYSNSRLKVTDSDEDNSSSIFENNCIATLRSPKGKSVQFDEILVAETFVYEKYTRFEIMNLFYTHDDAIKFQYDFECESQQAMKEGKSWIEYIS